MTTTGSLPYLVRSSSTRWECLREREGWWTNRGGYQRWRGSQWKHSALSSSPGYYHCQRLQKKLSFKMEYRCSHIYNHKLWQKWTVGDVLDSVLIFNQSNLFISLTSTRFDDLLIRKSRKCDTWWENVNLWFEIDWTHFKSFLPFIFVSHPFILYHDTHIKQEGEEWWWQWQEYFWWERRRQQQQYLWSYQMKS